jgi:hypothetical protein
MRLFVSCFILLGLTMSCYASFIDKVNDIDLQGAFTGFWEWHQGVAPLAGPILGRDQWLVQPIEAAPGQAGAGPGLTLNLQHRVGPHAGENANPVQPLTVDLGNFPAGAIRAGGLVVLHPGVVGQAHRDAYKWAITSNSVEVEAEHVANLKGFGWSYDPLGTPGALEVEASYATDPNELIFKEKNLNGAEHHLPVPDSAKGQPPTDYKVKYTLGDPSSTATTLAFLTGSFGDFTEADLGLMTNFFAGDQEFLVPMLFDGSNNSNLFAAVDLTQWLSFPTAFNNGDQYSFVNGKSAALPGFVVGTSEVMLDPSVGFTTANPFTGTLIAKGIIDGQSIPEPSALVPLGGCLLVGAFLRMRRSHSRA